VRPVAILLLSAVISTGCQTAEDKERAAFRERLREAAPLSQAEVSRLIAEAVRAIGGRQLIVQELGGTRELPPEARSEVLSVLTSGASVADVGLKQEGGQIFRGLSGPGTPARSELDATRTLWIDIRSLLPRRYEFAYSLPGYGDYAYDLKFGP